MAKRTPVRGLAKNPVAFERYVAATDVPLLVLAVLWLPVLILPWVMTLSPDVAESFTAIDYMVWAAFAVDYMIRIYLAPNRKHFFTHNLVDLIVVIVPFLRPLRALRVVRVLELGRVVAIATEALQRARNILTHRGLHYVLLAVLVIMLVCSWLVLLFERHAHGATIRNFPDALWWSIVTVTTVGYGDTYPVTGAGRGVAVVLMLVGIGLIGVLTATVASFFVRQDTDDERDELMARIKNIETILARVFPEALQDEHLLDHPEILAEVPPLDDASSSVEMRTLESQELRDA